MAVIKIKIEHTVGVFPEAAPVLIVGETEIIGVIVPVDAYDVRI